MQDEPTKVTGEETHDAESEPLIVNPLKRVAMVIFSPRLVFESLSVKSTRLDWILPLGLTLLFSITILNAGYEYLRNDQIEAGIKRIEQNKKLTAEQKSAQIEQVNKYMEKMAGFTHIMVNVSAVIGAFAVLVIIALIMQAFTAFILHGHLTFVNAFKIGALGSMVSLVGLVVKLPLLYYFESFAQAKLSIGFLFPEDLQESFLVKVIDFDLFTLWYLVILCIGMSVFAKTSLKKALIPMTAVWLLYRIAAEAVSVGLSGIGS
jgi:hypothetical protein